MAYVIIALAAGAILIWPLRRWLIRRRRARVGARPFPDAWRALLDRDVPLIRSLPDELRERLERDIHVFLDEKDFHGLDGLEVDDTMRLVVASQACLLALNQPERHYPDFTSILIYPDSFVVEETHRDGWLETTGDAVRAGESWDRGPIVLSWADVLDDIAHPGDGCNVVLHEFAHKLDEQEGGMDGAPALDSAQYASWARVLMEEYEALRADAARHRDSVLDDYGAVSPAEFFAVATETFFERPSELRGRHAVLYGELARFYRLDPAAW